MKRNFYIYIICAAFAALVASCAFMRSGGIKATYTDGERSVVLSVDSMKWHGNR